jgi:glycine/D-amino acid oxidase-like deaminating enzyme
MAEWRRLAAELPDLPLSWCGGLLWDLPPAELEGYAREHAAWGYGIRRIDRDTARRIEPSLADPPDFALHVAEEGAVEPAAAARPLVGGAVRRGALFLSATSVTGLVERLGACVGVETSADVLEADEIVVAAGADTPRLAANIGVNVALTPPPGLIVHSHPHSRLLNGIVMSPRLHMRQTPEGRVIAGSDFAGGDPGPDAAATARELFAKTKAMLKGAERLMLDFHTVGYRPTPADGFPILGRPKALRGVYVAVTHSGITLAPGGGSFRGRGNSRGPPQSAPRALRRRPVFGVAE